MSLYMSESLIGNVNLNQLEDNALVVFKIKSEVFSIREMTIEENKISIEIAVDDKRAYNLLSKKYEVNNFYFSWMTEKTFRNYQVVSLKHFLDNDVNSYILKLQINF